MPVSFFTELSIVTDRSYNVGGMHFFHPVLVMKLVELVKGHHTFEEAFQTEKTLLKNLEK